MALQEYQINVTADDADVDALQGLIDAFGGGYTVEVFDAIALISPTRLDVGQLASVRQTGAVYQRAADTATDAHLDYSNAGGVKWYVLPRRKGYDVRDFGAAADGVTDDTAAIQSAVRAFLASSETRKLVFGARHLVTDSIDFTHTGGKRGELVAGDTIGMCNIIVKYNGYGADAKTGAVFQGGDAGNPAYQTAIGMSGFLFTRDASISRPPLGIQGASFAQSRIDNIDFGGWENTTISLLTPQNVRMDTVTTFGGGLTFGALDADGITVTQFGNTLTASAPIFTTAHVDRWVAVWGTGSSTYRRKVRITGFTSSTVVTVEESLTDATPRRLILGSAGATTTAGGTSLVADEACFTSDHEGLVVWIAGAGANGGLHRATLTSYVDANTFTISPAAETATTKAEFGVAAVEIYSDPDFGNGASDVQITKLQIEGHKGIGLCVSDVDILHVQGKIHAEQTINSRGDASISAIWADRWAGSFRGDFDGQYIGRSRAYVTNQTKSLHIPSLHTRLAYNDTILFVGPYFPTYEGAMVVVGDVATSGGSSTETINSGLFRETSPGYGYTLNGTVSQAEYDKTLNYLSRQAYVDDDGVVHAEAIDLGDAVSFTPVVSDGTNIASGSFSGTERITNGLVRVTMRLLGIDKTGLTAGASLHLGGLPTSCKGGTDSFGIGSVRMNGVTFSGIVVPWLDDGDGYLFLYQSSSGGTSSTIKVSDVASGADIWVDITYPGAGL